MSQTTTHASGLSESITPFELQVTKRDGRVVEFEPTRIHRAIEAAFRADVLRNLKGARGERLENYLLDVLAADPEADVRAEAAESLGPFSSKARVRTALENAARSDASASVRAAALEALEQ